MIGEKELIKEMMKCKKCKKQMVPRLSLPGDFWYKLQYFIDIVTCNPPKQYIACKSKVPNPRYSAWVKDKEKIEEENKQIRKRIENGEDLQEIPVPKQPPKMIPCSDHYKLKSTGKYFEKTVHKTPQKFKLLGSGLVGLDTNN